MEYVLTLLWKEATRPSLVLPPKITALVWELISEDTPAHAQQTHLLWACMFLKTYENETVHSTIAGVDSKTSRQWTWII